MFWIWVSWDSLQRPGDQSTVCCFFQLRKCCCQSLWDLSREARGKGRDAAGDNHSSTVHVNHAEVTTHSRMKLPTCWLPNLSSTSFHLGKDSRVAHGSSTTGSHRSTPVSANFLTLCNLDFSLPLVMWWTAKWLSASKTESVSGLVDPDEFQEVAWRGHQEELWLRSSAAFPLFAYSQGFLGFVDLSNDDRKTSRWWLAVGPAANTQRPVLLASTTLRTQRIRGASCLRISM